MTIEESDLPVIRAMLVKLIERRTLYGPEEIENLPGGESQWYRVQQLFLLNGSAKEGAMNKGKQVYVTESSSAHLATGYYDELYRSQYRDEQDQILDREHKRASIAAMRKTRRISILALIVSVISLLVTVLLGLRS